MLEEEPVVELSQLCSRSCHVLDAATRQKDVNNLSSLERKIEDFTKVYQLVSLISLAITSNVRTVRDIESVIRESTSHTLNREGIVLLPPEDQSLCYGRG